ncbi:hypothetical protein ABH916_000283 [Peribacillus frigoritolerans]
MEKKLKFTLFNSKVMYENGVPKNWRSVFLIIYLRFSKESMEYYNLNRKDMVDTVMADMADNKGRVGNNIQIQDLEPTMLQQQDHLRSLSQFRIQVFQIRILGVRFDNH